MRKINTYILTILTTAFLIACGERESELIKKDKEPIFLIKAKEGIDTSYVSELIDSMVMAKKFEMEYRLIDEELDLNAISKNYIFSAGSGKFEIESENNILSFIPNNVGYHEITIEIIDNYNRKTSVKVKLYVFENYPPIPKLTFTLINNEYKVDASDSFDPDGEIVNYHFDYGINSIDWQKPIVNIWAQHVVDNGGVSLTLTDNSGNITQPVFFSINN